MAIWVCRTGAYGQFEEVIFNNSAIYLTRDGFGFDLAASSKEAVVDKISEIMPGAARQTISNTWSQIDIFANRMTTGDVVIVPRKKSMRISVGIITGEYCYNHDADFPLQHARTVKFVGYDIDTNAFPQDIKYSLGAFRSIFSVRQEERLLDALKKAGVVFP